MPLEETGSRPKRQGACNIKVHRSMHMQHCRKLRLAPSHWVQAVVPPRPLGHGDSTPAQRTARSRGSARRTAAGCRRGSIAGCGRATCPPHPGNHHALHPLPAHPPQCGRAAGDAIVLQALDDVAVQPLDRASAPHRPSPGPLQVMRRAMIRPMSACPEDATSRPGMCRHVVHRASAVARP